VGLERSGLPVFEHAEREISELILGRVPVIRAHHSPGRRGDCEVCGRRGLHRTACLRYLPIPALQQVMPGLGHSPVDARRPEPVRHPPDGQLALCAGLFRRTFAHNWLVDKCLDAVSRMYYESGDPDCWSPAERVAANLVSGWGIINAPCEVLQMIRQAIETGYATVLEHVRDGQFDGQIALWRSV
jgi:hypothetical protein